MSWSVYLIGTPAAIVTALHKESERLTGVSKEEFDKIKPHLVAIVESNYHTNVSGYAPAYKLAASGHKGDGYGNCNVIFENTGCTLYSGV